jgi:hypothetical protein
VFSTIRPRPRLPLVVVILLLVLWVVALGFVCLCSVDHPTQAAERAAAVHAPAVIVLWSFLVLFFAPLLTELLVAPVRARDRASPAALQRFLF